MIAITLISASYNFVIQESYIKQWLPRDFSAVVIIQWTCTVQRRHSDCYKTVTFYPLFVTMCHFIGPAKASHPRVFMIRRSTGITSYCIMNQICHPRSHSTKADMADARDALRAQFPRRLWQAKNHYLTTSSIGLQSEDSKSGNNHPKRLRAITARKIGAGAFMKGEVLQCVDGRIFIQGTGMRSGRGPTYGNHRRTSVMRGRTPDIVVSSLGIDIDQPQPQPQCGKRQVEHDGRTLMPIQTSGFTAEMEESRYFMGRDRYSWSNALDTQQADEMFNLFINIEE